MKHPDGAGDIQKGYVSSYDVGSASGFIRPDLDPGRLVSFRQNDLTKDAEYVLEIGQEVHFSIAEDARPGPTHRWDVAGHVEIAWADETDGEIAHDPLD
jgi:cold shock CspA family protein